jgi:hypothetical protein
MFALRQPACLSPCPASKARRQNAGDEVSRKPYIRTQTVVPQGALPEAPPGATRKRPFIYVYDLPPLFHSHMQQVRGWGLGLGRWGLSCCRGALRSGRRSPACGMPPAAAAALIPSATAPSPHPCCLTPHPSPLTPATPHPSPLTPHPSPLTPHPSPLTAVPQRQVPVRVAAVPRGQQQRRHGLVLLGGALHARGDAAEPAQVGTGPAAGAGGGWGWRLGRATGGWDGWDGPGWASTCAASLPPPPPSPPPAPPPPPPPPPTHPHSPPPAGRWTRRRPTSSTCPSTHRA